MSNNTANTSTTEKDVKQTSTTAEGDATGEKGVAIRDNTMQLGQGVTYLQSGATERSEKAKRELEKDHEASANKQYKNKNRWFGMGMPPGQELQEQRRDSTSEVTVTEEKEGKPLRGVRDELDPSFKRESDKTKKKD